MALLRTPDQLRSLLQRVKTIAVVGLSADPGRDSHHVSAYMQDRGYRIIGINPHHRELLGGPAYPSLEEIPAQARKEVDLVNVFRRPEAAQGVARSAALLGLPAIWFQLGVATPEAVAEADKAGMDVVADSCLMVAHRMLLKG